MRDWISGTRALTEALFLLDMDPVSQTLRSTFLAGIADIDCGPFNCNRISIGLPFTAVSVRRAE